ncbi:MAG TPA: PAS domain S-box protein, partial [Thermomicrobiales bacterium]|nr:PAS domain S-box protein [Thermomicrobiales bacterium]
AGAATTDEVLAVVEAHARAAIGATALAAAVIDERDARLRLLTPRAAGGKRVARRSAAIGADRPLAQAAMRGAVVAHPGDETAADAILAVPLIADGAPLGAIELQFDRPRAIDDADRAFAQTLANLCAQALARARTFDREREARTKAEALEMRFRATFEQAAIGMGHALPSGRWLRVNPRLCELLGYERDELLRLTFFDVTDPADRAANAEIHARLLRGEIETAVLEKRMRRKDGTPVWVAVTSAVVRDAAGRPAYTIAALEDVSRRKADEAERERLLAQGDAERARLETVLQQLPVGVVIADAGGEILMANRQVDAILGAAPAPFAAVADDGQPPHAALERAIRGGETVEAAEFRVRRADGGVGLVRANAAPVRDRAGRIVAGVLTMEDITGSRREETAQRLLAAVGEFLAAPIDDATALEALARLTLPDFADACLIELDGAAGGSRALVVAAVDPAREAAWRSAPWPSAAVPGAFDPFAALMRAGLPALLADGASEPALATAFGAPPPASILAVPLTLRGRTSG